MEVRSHRGARARSTFALALALLASCAAPRSGGYASPEEAVRALVEAGDDAASLDAVLGPGGEELLGSGDAVADRADREHVRALADERIAFEDVGPDRKVALLGEVGWRMPLPLVREDGAWSFDLEAGREEVLNRRVGRNELLTIATLRAVAVAQRDYFSAGRDGNPPAFAQRLVSSAGKRDGLYWPAAEGEPPSPIAAQLADAAHEGYAFDGPEPRPYHGYFYRLLTAQGEHAPGGARGYLDDAGRLTGGFAVLAWPATYDNSGVMSFQVGALGIVYEKDLGPDTARAAAIEVHDPDPSWRTTED